MRRYPAVAPWRVARQRDDACLCDDCVRRQPWRAALVEEQRRYVKALTDRNLRLRDSGEYYRQ